MAQPDNDAFQHRLALVGTNVVFEAYLLDATLEPGEPDHAQPYATTQSSVWWTWTAPDNGILDIAPPGSTVAARIGALYRGLELTSLTRVTNWAVQAGETYQIVRFAPDPSGYTSRALELDFYPPPPNDHFTNSILLEGLNPHFEGYTYGATREPGETVPGAGTLWWHWRAPSNGVARLQTNRDYYYGAKLGIFQGNAVNALEAVPYVYGPYSAPEVDVKAGELYYFMVAAATPQDCFRFIGQIAFSPLRIESPVSGTVYSGPTDVIVRLSSTIPESAYSSVGIYASNGYTRVESPTFVSQLILSNLPAGQYSIRASAWDQNHSLNYLSPEVFFRVLLPNDNFISSATLEGTNVLASGDMRGATSEPGETDNKGSLWWHWIAPISGWGILHTINGNVPRLEVFQGDQLSTLTPVPRRPDIPDVGTFAFPISQGSTYRIRATGEALPSYPSEFFRLTVAPGLLNDDFTNRATLVGDRNSLEALLLLATPEPGEPPPVSALDMASVWYTWTATVPGVLVGRMIKANEWRDGVAIFSGDSLSALRGLGNPVHVQAGQTCQIALYGNRFFLEPVSAELSFFPVPVNGSFESAQVLPGTEGETTGQNVGATAETGFLDGRYQSVWYEWTAPSNGLLSIAVSKPAVFSPNAAVYNGSNLSSLTLIEARNSSWLTGTNGGLDWALSQYDVQANTTYRIAIFSEQAYAGPFTFTYRFEPAPTNDLFAGRTLLAGKSCAWSGSTELASRETGELLPGQALTGRSLWWQWIAPTNAWAWFAVASTNFSAMIGVYEGTVLSNLSLAQIVPGTNLNELWFKAQAGHSYCLLVDSFLGDTSGGDFIARLQLTTAQVVLSNQDPDFTAPRQVSVELSQIDPAIDGDLAGATFYLQSFTNLLGQTTTVPFGVETPLLQAGTYRVFALATNRAGEIRHCVPSAFSLSPTNDSFVHRQLLQGRSGEVLGTFAGAGRDLGEPQTEGFTNAPSVWYTWQARADGEVVMGAIDLAWPERPVGIGIYTGEVLAALQGVPLSIRPDPWEVRFQAFRGQIYQIAVVGFGEFVLRYQQTTVSFVSPQAYAEFTEGDPITLEVTTTERPEEIAAIDFFYGDKLLGSAAAAPYRFIWTNAPAGTVLIGASGRMMGDQTSPPVDQVQIGVIPRNDTFATRQSVSGTNLDLVGNTTYARGLDGEPVRGRVWFTWTAPSSGLLRLEPLDGQLSPYITVFSGNTAAELITVATNFYSWDPPFPLAFLVRPEMTYHIAVGSTRGDGNFDLQLIFEPAPFNDDFAHRALLTGNAAHIEGSLAIATAEPGEPLYYRYYGDLPRHSLWWNWVAPERGIICLSNLVSKSEFYWYQIDYGFYSGSSLGDLVLLTNINSSMPVPMFAVEGGESYNLSINDPADNVDNFSGEFMFFPAPPNDNYADRQVLVGRQVRVTGSTLGATAEPGEPARLFSPAEHSVWYSWTAPFSGIAYYYRGVFGSAYYTAYTGNTLSALVPAPHPVDTFASFFATEGTTYAITADSLGGLPGDFELSLILRHNTAPPNDLLADRIVLRDGAAPVEGWNHTAGREWQEPNHANRWCGRSVWYSWTPAAGGAAVIRLSADERPLLIAAYEGTTVTNLVSVGHTASTNRQSELWFPARGGHEYLIAIDGENGATSDFEIQVALRAVELPPYVVLQQTEQGQWFIRVGNLAGRSVRLETSSDLVEWDVEANYGGGTDDWFWALPTSPLGAPGAKFFRAVIAQ